MRDDLWPADRVTKLKDHWNAGMSASQVMHRLNEEFGSRYTRSAVIGKIHRLNLPQRSVDAQRTAAKVERARLGFPRVRYDKPKARVRVIDDRQAFVEGEPRPPRAVVDAARAFAPLDGSTPRPWTERAFNECSWPVGEDDEGTLLACSRAATPGGNSPTWCEDHKAFNRARAPKTSTPRDLARSLRRHAA